LIAFALGLLNTTILGYNLVYFWYPKTKTKIYSFIINVPAQTLLFDFRNQTSLVNLQLLRNDKKVDQVVYGREYILRADMSQPDGEYFMKGHIRQF
jgi:hypothetical protein